MQDEKIVNILNKLSEEDILYLYDGIPKGDILTYIASKRNTTFENDIPKKYQTSKDSYVMSAMVEELLRIGRYDIIKNEIMPSKSAAFSHGMLTNNDYVRSIFNMDMTMLEKMVELLDRRGNNNTTVDNDITVISRYNGMLTLENSTSIIGQHLMLAYRYYVSNNHSTVGFDYIRDKLRSNAVLIKAVNAIDLRWSDWLASMMPTAFEESMAILSEELCKTIMLFPNIQHIYVRINDMNPVEKDLRNSSLEIFLAKLHNTKRFDFVKMLHPSALWTIVKSELFEKYVEDKSIIPVLHTILM